jgi:glycosyltransferase involved in cell wall biosynthesis
MQILQVYRDYFTELPGGIERHVHDLAHGLQYLGGVEVLVSSRSKPAATMRDGAVTVHRAREIARVRGLPLTPGYASVMRRGFDVVHLHAPNPTAELAFSLARPRAAGIMTYHADLDRGARTASLYNRLLQRTFNSCQRVLVSSERLVAVSPVLSRLQAERPAAIEVVPFGVDTKRFSPDQTQNARQIRQSWRSNRVVLFVGRLRPYKGLPYLIKALQSVDATLVVVGDGSERERIVTLGRDLLANRFVLVPGVRDEDLPDYYRAADLFALPSTTRAETFGLAVLEAMASGLPVVTTEVHTATSVVNVDGETGFVVPPADSEKLAASIRALLDDEERYARVAEASRRRVVEHYDLRQMLDRIAEIYQEVVATTSVNYSRPERNED